MQTFLFFGGIKKEMKSIRCRMGWHKRKIMVEHPMKGLNSGIFTECERCGLAEKWTVSLAVPGGSRYSVPLSEEIAREGVNKVEEALKCSFENFNKANDGTQTKKDFAGWQEDLSKVRTWFMKFAGDWRPSLKIKENNFKRERDE